ncbi:adenosine 5'-monophosphoramidase HINT2-like [Plodia interpunctella]|uniref:adenosine 5'-monophosphoramidase HINT2-like n=1 Tax=Plodia interpunctella TaxID=58824 RepID=UPI00236779D6|nr:adenosine 5'-monophosphoramidase HINT2-like [Plodia interpunctella]
MTAVQINNRIVFGGKIQNDYIYQDDQCVAFEAEDKQAPDHFIVVPRKTIPRLSDATVADERLLGHMLLVAKGLAADRGLSRAGYHTVVDEDHRTRTLVALHVFERSLLHMLWPTSLGSRL